MFVESNTESSVSISDGDIKERARRIIVEFRNGLAPYDVDGSYVVFFDDRLAALNKAGNDAEALAIADRFLR